MQDTDSSSSHFEVEPPWETWLARHLPEMEAFIRRRAGAFLGPKESHADLIQSACRELWQNLDRFEKDGESGFRRWMLRTAERKIQDRWRYWRAEKRDARMEVGLPAGAPAEAPTPSQEAVLAEAWTRLDHAFAKLPEDMQEVVFFARFLRLSRQEIALRAGRSEGAVRVLLHRSLAKLAAWLDPEGESGNG
ncbi:MAG: sigma-70 family RNA polymerase sigma factor [Planctomycetota bacterium]|nr:MAG: sigma-70 family RNA polymerase sigma factor [Planctomycetota bacterium]